MNVENVVTGVVLTSRVTTSVTLLSLAPVTTGSTNGGDDVLIVARVLTGYSVGTVRHRTPRDRREPGDRPELGVAAGNGETSEGIDKLIDIENVTTGSGEDVLIGNDGANVLTVVTVTIRSRWRRC